MQVVHYDTRQSDEESEYNSHNSDNDETSPAALLRNDKKEIASWMEEHNPYFEMNGNCQCGPIGQSLKVEVVPPDGPTLVADFSLVQQSAAKTFSAVRTFLDDERIPNPSQKVLAALHRRLNPNSAINF